MVSRATSSVIALSFLLAAGTASAVDLVGIYELAATNDPQLRAASYRRDATGENVTQARSALLPYLAGSAGITRGDSETAIAGIGTVSNNDIETQSWGLDLRQTLYDHANYKQLEVARGQVGQAEAQYAAAYQNFLVRVAGNYFEVLTAVDGVRFAEAEELALQRQFEQAEQRFEVGLTAVTDVHEARASYDNARARAIVARNRLEDAKEGLRELTGQYFDEVDPLQEVLPLVEPDPASADEWVDLAMSNNPSVIAAQRAVEIADSNAKLQRSGHYPTVDLTASVGEFTNENYLLLDDLQNPIGNADLTQDSTNYSLRLNVPIYQGGFVSSRTRQARHLLNATQQDLDVQQRATLRATENAYRAVMAGIKQVEAFGQALISAKSALDATQAGFEVGTRTIVDVLIAEQRYFQAQRDNSNAHHTYIVDHLRLKAAAGLLSDADLRAVNQILE